MTDIAFVKAAGLSQPVGHYSHATRANGFVFVSGLLPVTADGKAMTGAPFADQVAQVFANLEEVLRSCDTAPSRLVQVRVYVTEIANWGAFNRLYAAWIGETRPARCVVPVPELHHGLALEIEAVALDGPASSSR